MGKILLIDDSEHLVDGVSTILKLKGYEIETALSKDKIKNALSVFEPDLIFLDVKLGDDDGRQLCKDIKEKYNKNIPVVLISAHHELLENYEECKADAIIEKPFDIQTIMEQIENILSK